MRTNNNKIWSFTITIINKESTKVTFSGFTSNFLFFDSSIGGIDWKKHSKMIVIKPWKGKDSKLKTIIMFFSPRSNIKIDYNASFRRQNINNLIRTLKNLWIWYYCNQYQYSHKNNFFKVKKTKNKQTNWLWKYYSLH